MNDLGREEPGGTTVIHNIDTVVVLVCDGFMGACKL